MADQTKIARRTFFAGLGLAAAAGIAAKISSKTAIPEVTETTPSEPKGDGYRLTEHVKKYYRTTTI
ncbi:hypothetical protein [Noviherbaspirillum sp. Root189]|uniref:hypothetical protein n=1 Tax=Noviherbaspirillum sp. Root189 TaxID=1736487 RepID=UPI00070FD300|nr:hypothetical protein [Noviherbaspirillum sp. Root189]KRB94040.1 hypothetical protein ASE07_00375 [Noviherbaspirillum sp. Root189]